MNKPIAGQSSGMPDNAAQPTEVLAGSIERVTFHNAENGFCVLRIKARGHRDLVTVVGHAAEISAGEWVTVSGTWVNSREHGQQFRAAFLRSSPPTTAEGIEKYLGSGMIRGIGPIYASKLVAAFGAEVFEVIEQAPERLREVPGIGQVRASRIAQAWADQKVVREIMVFLHSHGVGTARAVRIFKTYGNDAVQVMAENPYRLARDIRGIGFRTADAIAARLGIEPTATIRLRAGINYALLEASGEGHCGLPTAELLKTPVESASEDDEDEVDLDKIIYQGARVQVCFGGPGQETAAAFYGALVGRQVKDDEGTWWILGFDDGDVRSFKVEDLKGMLKCHSLDALDGEAGLIRNKPAAAASEFFYFENNNQKKVVGLLVGKEEERKVFDLPVFQDFYVVPNAFTPSRSGRSGGAQSTQDRLGIHTFRRGDLVLYQHGEPHETMSSMAIWGVCNHVPEGNSQARKFLVIYDMAAKTFFLGAWPAWLRIPNPEKLVDGEGGSVSFDCDNDEHVKMMTPQQCKAKWWLSGLCLRPHSSLLGPSRRRRRTPRSRHLRSRPTARGRRRRRGRGRRMRTEIGRRERGRTSRWGGGRGETRNLLSGRHRLIRESAPIRATQQAGAHH